MRFFERYINMDRIKPIGHFIGQNVTTTCEECDVLLQTTLCQDLTLQEACPASTGSAFGCRRPRPTEQEGYLMQLTNPPEGRRIATGVKKQGNGCGWAGEVCTSAPAPLPGHIRTSGLGLYRCPQKAL